MHVAPEHRSKSPYFYPRKFGDGLLTVLSDGVIDLGDPRENYLGAEPAEVVRMLKRRFLASDRAIMEENVPLLDLNGKTVLFDTGMGDSTMFGTNSGRLLTSMAEAGRSPEEVDAVVLSHAHIDHVGGLADKHGNLQFPNAEIFISEKDFHDWTTGDNIRTGFEDQIRMAQRNLLPFRDRITFYKDGDEVLPGVSAFATPGHTMGHHSFILESAGEKMFFVGDMTHHSVLLVETPWLEFKFDTDPALAAKSRIRGLDLMAQDEVKMMSFHFAWPGIGNVSREGEGFRFHPEAMQLLIDEVNPAMR